MVGGAPLEGGVAQGERGFQVWGELDHRVVHQRSARDRIKANTARFCPCRIAVRGIKKLDRQRMSSKFEDLREGYVFLVER
jgi:hypothetical protein